MSDATFRLLTSAEFISAIAIGAFGIGIVLVWAVATRKPSPAGGIVLTAGIAFVIFRTGGVPIGLILGLGLLLVAGLISFRSPLATMAILLPGALVIALIALPRIITRRSVEAVLLAAAIIILALLVASFDTRFAPTTVATPLIAISFVSVFLTVPDTEFAVLAAGAALPWLVAGPPAKLARLGRSGSFVAVGMIVWLVVTGGSARPLSILAGIATLGVLIIEPVIAAVRGQSKPDSGADAAIASGTVTALVVAHVAIQAVIAIVVRV